MECRYIREKGVVSKHEHQINRLLTFFTDCNFEVITFQQCGADVNEWQVKMNNIKNVLKYSIISNFDKLKILL